MNAYVAVTECRLVWVPRAADAAERTYHESWRVVQRGMDPGSPWAPFVENWAGDEFAGYVGYLGDELVKLAAAAGLSERARTLPSPRRKEADDGPHR